MSTPSPASPKEETANLLTKSSSSDSKVDKESKNQAKKVSATIKQQSNTSKPLSKSDSIDNLNQTKMDKKTTDKAGNFWTTCKTCSKQCLCICGLKDPKKIAIASAVVIGLGIFIYRGWYREIPEVAKSVVKAPVNAIKGRKSS